jgi:hypothetical protein
MFSFPSAKLDMHNASLDLLFREDLPFSGHTCDIFGSHSRPSREKRTLTHIKRAHIWSLIERSSLLLRVCAHYEKLWLSPQDSNNQTNFNVVASFEGDASSVAKASMALPNGTMIDVCTTIQYNTYKPSSNSTTITVYPQKTEGATTLVDFEAMQQKAESKQALKVWIEFSLWFPWVKVVAEVNVPFGAGVTTFRSELMPLAFSQITNVVSGAEWFIQEFQNVIAKIGIEVVAGYILAFLMAKATAWWFGLSSLPGLFLAVIGYVAATLAMTWGLNLLFGKDGLLVGVVSFFIALSIDLVIDWLKGEAGFLKAFLRGIYVGASTGSIESMWHSWWGSSMNFFNIVETAAFYFVDLGLGAGLAVWS